MPKLPKVSKIPGMPEGFTEVPLTPIDSAPNNTIPSEKPVKNSVPLESPQNVTTPAESSLKEEVPSESPVKTETPFDDSNYVVIKGEKIEIKPTKLKYFRNKTASAYNLLKSYPLSELLVLKAGVIDQTRDGDAVVYDFLVSAFDDADFVRDNYNEMDAEQVERIVQIVGRLNHIEDKLEAQRKNREAQGNR